MPLAFAAVEITALRRLLSFSPEFLRLHDMNVRGDVVGSYETNGKTRSFRVFRQSYEELTARGDTVAVTSLNDAGVAVGVVRDGNPGNDKALLWELAVSAARVVGSGSAEMVNNNGTVLISESRVTDGQMFGDIFLIPKAGSRISLEPPAWMRNAGFCAAGGMNNRGRIVGVQRERTLLLWTGRGGGALPQEYAGWSVLQEAATLQSVRINDRGSIAGVAVTNGLGNVAHILFWEPGAPRVIYGVGDGQSLLNMNNRQRVTRISLNNRDECIVEVSVTRRDSDGKTLGQSSQCYLWRGGKADRLPLDHVYAINDRGQIAGRMNLRGRDAFVLLSPRG